MFLSGSLNHHPCMSDSVTSTSHVLYYFRRNFRYRIISFIKISVFLKDKNNIITISKILTIIIHELVSQCFHFVWVKIQMGFPGGASGKEPTCQCRRLGRCGFDLWLGRSPRDRKGYPLQYSGLENSVDCIVHGVTKSQTRLSNFHFF